MPESGFKLTPV